jgi:hypothetical protein
VFVGRVFDTCLVVQWFEFFVLCVFEGCIGRGDVDRTIPNLIGLPPAQARAAPIVDLFWGAGSALPTVTQHLIGRGKVRPPDSGQVALRFPLHVGAKRVPLDGKSWHIDGFGHGKHSPFTLLVGVALSDATDSGCGNFAVHPGAHWSTQDAVRAAVAGGGDGAIAFSNLQSHDTKPNLGAPMEVLLRAGDVVLAHQKLPHLGTPNYSPHVRYQGVARSLIVSPLSLSVLLSLSFLFWLGLCLCILCLCRVAVSASVCILVYLVLPLARSVYLGLVLCCQELGKVFMTNSLRCSMTRQIYIFFFRSVFSCSSRGPREHARTLA